MRIGQNASGKELIHEEGFDNNHVYLMIDEGNQSKSLMTIFDINTRKEKTKNLRIKCLDRGSCIISLPNSKLFTCGNGWVSVNAFSYIIDTKNWSHIMLPPLDYFFSAGGVYHKGIVYIFGGQAANYLSQALKFDLITNRWHKISKLPQSSNKCSCAVFNNKILLSGVQHSTIYLYDIDADSYSIFMDIKLEVSCKYFVTDKKRAYIIEQLGNIWESGVFDEYSWKFVAKVGNSSFYYEQMHYVLNKNIIYIGESEQFYHQFFEFNLDNKSFERIQIKSCSIF